MCACINRFGTDKKKYKLSSWDFFFKTSTITLYENAKDLKFRCPNEEKKLFYFWTLKPPKRPNSLLVWIDQKNFFSSYVI